MWRYGHKDGCLLSHNVACNWLYKKTSIDNLYCKKLPNGKNYPLQKSARKNTFSHSCSIFTISSYNMTSPRKVHFSYNHGVGLKQCCSVDSTFNSICQYVIVCLYRLLMGYDCVPGFNFLAFYPISIWEWYLNLSLNFKFVSWNNTIQGWFGMRNLSILRFLVQDSFDVNVE